MYWPLDVASVVSSRHPVILRARGKAGTMLGVCSISCESVINTVNIGLNSSFGGSLALQTLL